MTADRVPAGEAASGVSSAPAGMTAREKCDCGRLIATAEDWASDDIEEGDRDDLCWGAGANHEQPRPEPAPAAGMTAQDALDVLRDGVSDALMEACWTPDDVKAYDRAVSVLAREHERLRGDGLAFGGT